MNLMSAEVLILSAADLPPDPVPAPIEPEIVELSLLLPRWQAEALEAVAQRRGVTTGQLIRRCLGDLLRHLAD
jgi:hypothetical protein